MCRPGRRRLDDARHSCLHAGEAPRDPFGGEEPAGEPTAVQPGRETLLADPRLFAHHFDE